MICIQNALSSALLGCLILLLTSCDKPSGERVSTGEPSTKSTVSGTNIIAGKITRLADLVNIHSSKQKFIEVAGKRYVGVRGEQPYYLSIPEKDSIIFVTEENNYHSTIHVVNLKTQEHFSIVGAGSFGSWIDSGRTNGSPFTDCVEAVSGNRVTVVSRGSYSRNVMVVDLESKKVVHDETDYFDGGGGLTNREILVNGGWKPKELK